MTKRVMPKQSEDKKQERAREGAQAWADYQAEARATQEKTARLRALRLERDARDARDAATTKVANVKKTGKG